MWPKFVTWAKGIKDYLIKFSVLDEMWAILCEFQSKEDSTNRTSLEAIHFNQSILSALLMGRTHWLRFSMLPKNQCRDSPIFITSHFTSRKSLHQSWVNKKKFPALIVFCIGSYQQQKSFAIYDENSLTVCHRVERVPSPLRVIGLLCQWYVDDGTSW